MTTVQLEKTKDEIVSEYEEKGRKIGAQLDEMVAKAGDKKQDAQSEYHKRIAKLKIKYEAAQKKLAELRDSGAGKWHHFKVDLKTVWQDVETTIKGLTH